MMFLVPQLQQSWPQLAPASVTPPLFRTPALLFAIVGSHENFSFPAAAHDINAVVSPHTFAIVEHVLILRVYWRKRHDAVSQLQAAMPLVGMGREPSV